MTIAIYKSNSKSNPEQILVHRYSNGELHVEAVSNSHAHEVGGSYENLVQVEEYLAARDDVFGYTRVI